MGLWVSLKSHSFLSSGWNSSVLFSAMLFLGWVSLREQPESLCHSILSDFISSGEAPSMTPWAPILPSLCPCWSVRLLLGSETLQPGSIWLLIQTHSKAEDLLNWAHCFVCFLRAGIMTNMFFPCCLRELYKILLITISQGEVGVGGGKVKYFSACLWKFFLHASIRITFLWKKIILLLLRVITQVFLVYNIQ